MTKVRKLIKNTSLYSTRLVDVKKMIDEEVIRAKSSGDNISMSVAIMFKMIALEDISSFMYMFSEDASNEIVNCINKDVNLDINDKIDISKKVNDSITETISYYIQMLSNDYSNLYGIVSQETIKNVRSRLR